jgi:transcriptional regulator with XRE-family HTH domain
MPRRPTTDEKINKAIGSRLKAARRKKGLTQVELSVVLGIQPETVSRYESGAVPVSLATLFQLAEDLDVGVHELLDIMAPAAEGAGVLTVEEIKMVVAWRKMDRRGRRLVMELAELLGQK